MKKKDFLKSARSSSRQEILSRAVEVSERLLRARFSKAAGQLASSAEIKNIKKELARYLTVMAEITPISQSNVNKANDNIS
jgi:ribosomal protein L29